MRCVRGCPLPGHHIAGCCGCFCPCHEAAETRACEVGGGCWNRHDTCTGCAATPAVYGFLCYRCDRLLRDLLGDRESAEGPHGFAWIYEHLGDHLDPIVRGFSGSNRGGGDQAPVPIRLEILDLQFTISELLKLWMDAVIESVPHARLTGPKILTAGAIARWLLAHVTTLEASDFIADMVSELDELAGEAHRCAPWRAGAKVLSGVPCPWCHVTALRIPGGEIDVRCGHCGAWIDHKRYTMWAQYLHDSLPRAAWKRAST